MGVNRIKIRKVTQLEILYEILICEGGLNVKNFGFSGNGDFLYDNRRQKAHQLGFLPYLGKMID